MRCIKCNVDKHWTDFSKKTATKRNVTCKPCHRLYTQRHYVANKDVYIARAAKSNKEHISAMQKFIREIKNVSCADCGVHYPYWVMDFDHIDAKSKHKNVSRMLSESKVRIESEIKKCDVVCSNCHRQREHARLAGVAKLV